MAESIYQIAEKISKLYQEVYNTYLPLVEDVRSREISEDELSHFLDYLLNIACDEKSWGCIKRYVEDIYMYIRDASNFILKRIGRCEKMKINDYVTEYI